MLRLRTAVCFVALGVLAGCGAGGGSGVSGNFVGDLRNPDHSAAFSFSSRLNQGSGPTLNVSSFSFTIQTPCFSGSTSQTASLDHSGSFMMTISSASAGSQGNTINMQGKEDMQGNFQGTWTLTGLPACNGGGTFTLDGLPPV